MRWFAWLVALCLLAAGGARPPVPRTLAPHDATVEDASDRATLVPRRPTTFTPDKRSDRRIDFAPALARFVARPILRTLLATSAERSTRVAGSRSVGHSSRGSPATGAASSNPSSS